MAVAQEILASSVSEKGQTMILKYYYDKALAHASYIVGCQKTGEAIIVDPGRDIGQYLETAKREKLRIVGAAETHIHADYVSGALELAEQSGARLFVSDAGPKDWKYEYVKNFSHQLLNEGDSFGIGNVEFQVIHTPGHTPESISLVLTDRGGGANQPMGVFTGDFVFVGSVGRPDLLEEAAGIVGTAEPGARDLFRSLAKFRKLPDYLQVWPAHGAGSACGKGLGAVPSSTVGYEKLFNPALQYTDEQEFVDYILAEQPEAPKYFAIMKSVNKLGPKALDKLPPIVSLEPKELSAVVDDQQVVDTTAPAKFLAAHVPGTFNIPCGMLATWAGTILDYDKPVYLIGGADVAESIRVLRKIGINEIAGTFSRDQVVQAGLATGNTEQYSPEQVQTEHDGGQIEIIDVRSQAERSHEYIAGSDHCFLGNLVDHIEQFDPQKKYAFQCLAGGRSTVATSIAKRSGLKHVVNLHGGIAAWKSAGLECKDGKR